MKSDTLKITIVQTELIWEDPAANRSLLEERLKAVKQTQLIVLPEMFTTGFTMVPETLAESEPGITLDWMRTLAGKYQAAVTGSLIVQENGRYYNRLYFVYPDGEYYKYDKRHTFTLAGEHEVYAAGDEKLLVDYLGWKICPLICYDLRFPVWARNVENYDILLYVANWPERRISAWDTLLKARAIENMCYTIGVNRVGKDGNDHSYVGHSAVYDVLGEYISVSREESAFVETIQLEKNHIKKYRDRLRFLDDQDAFNLE